MYMYRDTAYLSLMKPQQSRLTHTKTERKCQAVALRIVLLHEAGWLEKQSLLARSIMYSNLRGEMERILVMLH